MSKFLFLVAAAVALPAAAPVPQQPFSSAQNDYNPSFDRSERLAVFARSEPAFKHAQIYVSRHGSKGWSEPTPIDFSDARYSDSDPWLTPDGRTLYFVSNRPTATEPLKKDVDIWRVHRTTTGWSVPEHLDGISSPGPELGPELHRGILTFASVRAGGEGGLDIYAARQTKRGFGRPELLAGPFNSSQSDSDFTLSSDGRTAAFWRGTSATADIYISHRTSSGWSEPAKLPDAVNIGPFNFTPNFSSDGREVWFASTRPRVGQQLGNADIFIASVPRAPK